MSAIDDPSIADLIEASIGARLENLWTSAVGKVISYSDQNQRAEVQLIQRQREPGNELGRKIPALSGVPVLWPRGKDWSQHAPLSAGDTVLVWMLVHSVDSWISDGVTDRLPARKGRFQLSSAICFPGISPDSDPLTADSTDPIALVFRAPLTIIRETAGNEDFLSKGTPADANFSALESWAVRVETALAAAGSPIIGPLGTLASTSTTKTKAE